MTGLVERVERYGVFLRLPGDDGRGRAPRGLLPREEMSEARDDLKKAFPLGAEVHVLILPPDEKGRVRLSQRALSVARERADVSAFMNQTRGSASFGTFAELLQKASAPQPSDGKSGEKKAGGKKKPR